MWNACVMIELWVLKLSSSSSLTYKTLDPAPYWPETGHAQMTFTELVALPADARETDRLSP